MGENNSACTLIRIMTSSPEGLLGYYPEAELVFGIVSPIGIDYRPAVETLKNYLEQFGYASREVKISDHFEDIASRLSIEVASPPHSGKKEAMWRKIQLGDQICKLTKQKDILALIATAGIEKVRAPGSDPKDPIPTPKTAHIIISLKRPQEVATLRRVYGPGFFLIGIAANDEERERYFEERGFGLEESTKLIDADAAESDDFGQRTRDTFYLSDCFISLKTHSKHIERFLDLVFGCPFRTPTFEERSMYLAYAASLALAILRGRWEPR